jgi:hypothetical protein
MKMKACMRGDGVLRINVARTTAARGRQGSAVTALPLLAPPWPTRRVRVQGGDILGHGNLHIQALRLGDCIRTNTPSTPTYTKEHAAMLDENLPSKPPHVHTPLSIANKRMQPSSSSRLTSPTRTASRSSSPRTAQILRLNTP